MSQIEIEANFHEVLPLLFQCPLNWILNLLDSLSTIIRLYQHSYQSTSRDTRFCLVHLPVPPLDDLDFSSASFPPSYRTCVPSTDCLLPYSTSSHYANGRPLNHHSTSCIIESSLTPTSKNFIKIEIILSMRIDENCSPKILKESGVPIKQRQTITCKDHIEID